MLPLLAASETSAVFFGVAIIFMVTLLTGIALIKEGSDGGLKMYSALGTITGLLVGAAGSYFFAKEKVDELQNENTKLRSIVPPLALVSLSYGNLLANEEQLEKRYGKPIAVTEGLQRTYRWGEYKVEVGLKRGLQLGFMRGLFCIEKIYREDGKPLGERDLQTILPQPPWQSQSKTRWTQTDKTGRGFATLFDDGELVFDWEPSPKMKEALLKAVELDL